MPNKFLNEVCEDPADMSMNVNVEEAWMPEPELMEAVPRRIVAYEEHPDRNRPNVPVFSGISGFLLVLGFALFGFSISGRGGNLPSGLVLVVVGIAGLVYFPYRLRLHLQRSEQLVERGTPVMARILSADNLSGDVYSRNVKYQVTIPGGELTHRSVNADDRTLPKRIPANVTALMDMQSGDCELYLALPYRAVPKPQVATPAPRATTTTPTQPTAASSNPTMGAVHAPVVPEIKREKPQDENKKTTETYE